MAKEIEVHAWCDRHMALDERIEGDEITVALDGPPVTLDLCAPCHKEIVEPLARLIAEHGVKVAPPTKTTKTTRTYSMANRTARSGEPSANGALGAECLWCDSTYSTAPGSGYGRHLQTIHGYATLREAFGATCPICGEDAGSVPLKHIRSAHSEMGFVHLSQAAIWARDHGDPHGVYAASLARVPSLAT